MGPPNFGSISQWVILDSSSRCSPLIAFLCTHALLLQTTLPCTSFADGLSPGATVAKNTSRLSSYTSRLSSYPGRLHRCRKQSSYLAIWIIWSPSKFQEAVIWLSRPAILAIPRTIQAVYTRIAGNPAIWRSGSSGLPRICKF